MYYVIEYAFLFGISSIIVFLYSSPSVSFHIKFWTVLTWVLNFSIALLVPEDVYLTLSQQNDSEQKQWVGLQYQILYWTVYLLTWTVIPVLQYSENAGDLNSRDRLKRSIKYNGVFYFYMLIGALILLFVLYYLDIAGTMGLRTYLKCLASCWGIFLLMIMMGYAMVEIPRSLWLTANYSQYLKYSYKKILQITDDLEDADFQFQKVISFILASQNSTNDEVILKYCEHSLKLIPEHFQQKIPKKYEQFLKNTNYLLEHPFCLESSIENHRLLKRIIALQRRLSLMKESFIKQAILYEDIILCLRQNRKLQTPLFRVSKLGNLWYCRLMPFVYKSFSILTALFSLIILIAQTQVFLISDSSILGWLLKVHNLQLLRILIFITICFISYMVYYSLFRIKLSHTYGLYRNGSDGPSLMFTTINFSRVGVAVVLNFLDMLKVESIYSNVMGAPEMGLLGNWVIKGMPGVLWLILLCHYFDVWGKIIRKLRLPGDFQFSGHLVTGELSNLQIVQKFRDNMEEKKSYFSEQKLQI